MESLTKKKDIYSHGLRVSDGLGNLLGWESNSNLANSQEIQDMIELRQEIAMLMSREPPSTESDRFGNEASETGDDENGDGLRVSFVLQCTSDGN